MFCGRGFLGRLVLALGLHKGVGPARLAGGSACLGAAPPPPTAPQWSGFLWADGVGFWLLCWTHPLLLSAGLLPRGGLFLQKGPLPCPGWRGFLVQSGKRGWGLHFFFGHSNHF